MDREQAKGIWRCGRAALRPRHDRGPGAECACQGGGTAAAGIRAPAMALKPFSAAHAGDWFIGRTGYTGEDGFEMMLPEADAGLWRRWLRPVCSRAGWARATRCASRPV